MKERREIQLNPLKRMVALMLVMITIASMLTSCKPGGTGDEFDMNTIDKAKQLSYIPSRSFSLTEMKYTLRRNQSKQLVSILPMAPCKGVNRSSVQISPMDTKEHNWLDYEVDLTAFSKGALITFEFYMGFIEGAAPDAMMNFAVRVNDQEVFSEDNKTLDWIFRMVDLSAYAGQTIQLSLGTKGTENISYGWCLFGEPVINAVQKPFATAKGAGRAEKAYAFTVEGDGKLGGGLKGSGKVELAYETLNGGDYYLLIEGKGHPRLRVNAGSGNQKSAVYSTGDAYRAEVQIANNVAEKTDWEVALGLSKDQYEHSDYDRVKAEVRKLLLELQEDNLQIDRIEFFRRPAGFETVAIQTADHRAKTGKDTIVNVTYKSTGTD